MAGTGNLQASVGAPEPDSPAPSVDGHEPTPTPHPDDARAPATAEGTPPWLWWAALTVVALPFVASAMSVFLGVGGDYHPGGDVAGTELHVRDVGRYELLLGPFSRDGWYHPGPALFYVLALPYRALGSSPAALAAGALLVNALSLAGMAAIAKRRGGTPLLLCMLLTSALMVRALGFGFLAMAWNPWITVLPYGLLVMLTWSMACGDRWALPLAALVATFVVQTHVGYAVLALPLLALGALWLVIGAFRGSRGARRAEDEVEHADGGADAGEAGLEGDGESASGGSHGAGPSPAPDRAGRLSVAVLLAVVVVVVAWLPPVLQQVNNEPGNLGVIMRWFGERGEDARDLADGWRVVTAQYGLWPEWLAGRVPTTVFEEPAYIDEPMAPLLLALVALAAVAGWRRPGGDARRLLAVWLVASVLGVVAVARTVGVLYAYRLSWTWPLGAIAGAYCLWVGWTWLADRFAGVERRALVPALAVAVVVVTGVDVVAAARAGTPEQDTSAVVGELGEEVADALPADAGPLPVVPTSFLAIGYGNGLMAELDRRGFDPRAPTGDPWVDDHREPPSRPWAVLMVVTDAQLPAAWDDADLEMLGYVSELRPDEVRERVARLERARAELASQEASGGEPIGGAQVEAVGRILPEGTAAAVFLAPPTRAPPPTPPTGTPTP